MGKKSPFVAFEYATKKKYFFLYFKYCIYAQIHSVDFVPNAQISKIKIRLKAALIDFKPKLC